MRTFLTLALITTASIACKSAASVETSGEVILTYLDTPEGWSRLTRSGLQDYGPLSLHFETQENLAYCGVASLATVLNALGVKRPEAEEFGDYRYFTQTNVLESAAESGVLPEVVARAGMTLKELETVFRAHGLSVVRYHAAETNVGTFSSVARGALEVENQVIVINYLRASLGQNIGGHISPLAAYDPASDCFLIMDVSRYKYPPVWVSADAIYKSMTGVDADSGKSRGFLLLTKD